MTAALAVNAVLPPEFTGLLIRTLSAGEGRAVYVGRHVAEVIVTPQEPAPTPAPSGTPPTQRSGLWLRPPPSGVTVTTAGDPVEAAARFPDRSLDLVFVDVPGGYHVARAVTAAWAARVRWGGVLAGLEFPDNPESILAVHDLLPLHEVERRGTHWVWRKIVPDWGRWTVPSVDPGDWMIAVPYVNRFDLLRRAVDSVSAHASRVVVIDQSEDGLRDEWDGRVSIFRWYGPRRFTTVQNWMQREAAHRGCRWLCFLHSDAACGPGTVELVLRHAAQMDAEGRRWGVIFTAYDAFACFSMRAMADVGCWDETFAWYVSDLDFYNRIRWRGWEQVCLPQAAVLHDYSQTRQAMEQGEQDAVHEETIWAEYHYAHKWGRPWNEEPAHEIPYGGRP
jgi:hypothetical protein